jgi:hypothetical protein
MFDSRLHRGLRSHRARVRSNSPRRDFWLRKISTPDQKRDNFRSDRYSESREGVAAHGWNPDDYIPKANASDSETGLNDTGVLTRIPLHRAPWPKTFSPDRSERRPLVDLEGTVFLARDPLGLNEVSSKSQDPCERLFAAASAPKLRQQLQAIPLEDFSIKTFSWTEEAFAAFVSAIRHSPGRKKPSRPSFLRISTNGRLHRQAGCDQRSIPQSKRLKQARGYRS